MNCNETGPINIGNPEEFTIKDLAELIRNYIDPALPIINKPLPQDDPLQRKPLISLAQRELDWSPKVSLAEGLKKTIDDFKARLKTESIPTGMT